MNAERLRKTLAKLLWLEYFCCLCGDKDNLVSHRGVRGHLFWVCSGCISDIYEGR